jgi:uncharacterized protein (DUF1697 family)
VVFQNCSRRAHNAGMATSAHRYALLLRGVNVGAKNSLPMATLRAMLEAAGCTNVATYIQSGNAVFTTTARPAALTGAIEEALAAYMKRPIATTLRTRAQLAAILAAEPFGAGALDPGRLYVTFLGARPTAAELAPLAARDFTPERYHAVGSEIFTWHPDGQGKSPLAAAIGKLNLRGAVTTRNWNTVNKLHAMLASD